HFAQRFLQRIDIEGEDAAHHDIVPGRTGGFELDRQRVDDVLILLAIIAGMDWLVFLVRRRLTGDEDEFARAFDRDDARIARMLVDLRRVDELLVHIVLPFADGSYFGLLGAGAGAGVAAVQLL